MELRAAAVEYLHVCFGHLRMGYLRVRNLPACHVYRERERGVCCGLYVQEAPNKCLQMNQR